MFKLPFCITAVCLSVLSLSCQKEVGEGQPENSNNNSIEGNYKFISIDAQTVSTAQVTDGTDVEKTVTFSNYTSENNTGTIRFDAQTATSTNLAYSVETTAKMYSYFNGTLEDSLEMPVALNMPPSSASSPYKLVGADSIYFSGGSIFMNNLQQTTTPSGGRYRFEDNKLLITSSASQTKTESLQGFPAVILSQVSIVVTLQKQ